MFKQSSVIFNSELFTSGDIQGAVNAYTLAIRIRPKMALWVCKMFWFVATLQYV